MIFTSIICSFFRMPYRRLEGFIGRISAYEPGLLAADYTALHKRISKPDLGIDMPENDAVDLIGIKATNRGDWMREKRGTQRRGRLKVHVAIDVNQRDCSHLKLPKKIPRIARYNALC